MSQAPRTRTSRPAACARFYDMAMPLSGGAERAAGGGGIHSNDRLSALLPQVCHMVAISRQGNTA